MSTLGGHVALRLRTRPLEDLIGGLDREEPTAGAIEADEQLRSNYLSVLVPGLKASP
jgi:hypothetical protein